MEGGQYICSEHRQLHGAVIKRGIFSSVSAASNNKKGEVLQLEKKSSMFVIIYKNVGMDVFLLLLLIMSMKFLRFLT